MVSTPATSDAQVDEQAFVGPVLVVRLEKQTVGCFPLDQPRIVMGRSRRADIVLDESGGVSREHAHVLVVDNEVVVEDLGSRNGTYVNGTPTDRRTLRPGDRITIGKYRLRYREGAAKSAAREAAKQGVHRLMRRWGRAGSLMRDSAGCALCGGPRDSEPADVLTRSRTMRCPQPDADAILAKVDALIDSGSRTAERPFVPGAHRLYQKLKERAPRRQRIAPPRARLQRVRGRRPHAPQP